jgi:hypothetical protein
MKIKYRNHSFHYASQETKCKRSAHPPLGALNAYRPQAARSVLSIKASLAANGPRLRNVPHSVDAPSRDIRRFHTNGY